MRKYGWKPSHPDARDLVADHSGLVVKEEVDPRTHMPDIYDQGQLGSCTGNAIARAFQYDRRLDRDSFGVPSRLDIYYGERQIEGSLGQGDTGAYGRDGFKFLSQTGALPEKLWPYDISKFEETPPVGPHHRHKLVKPYKRVARSIEAFKAVLSNNQTVAIGFSVYESFESWSVEENGVMPYPNVQRERLLGGHEVLVCGYLKNMPHHALVANSWGETWGQRGYFFMPWTVILNPSMSDDFWTIYRPAS